MSIFKLAKETPFASTLCAVAMIAGAPLSHANTQDVTFAYHPDELETSFGIKQLYKRMQNRAEGICETNGIKPISARVQEAACKQDVLNDFMAQIDDPRLDRFAADANA